FELVDGSSRLRRRLRQGFGRSDVEKRYQRLPHWNFLWRPFTGGTPIPGNVPVKPAMVSPVCAPPAMPSPALQATSVAQIQPRIQSLTISLPQSAIGNPQ